MTFFTLHNLITFTVLLSFLLSRNWLKLFFGIGILKMFLEKSHFVYSSALEFVVNPCATTVGSPLVSVDFLGDGVYFLLLVNTSDSVNIFNYS